MMGKVIMSGIVPQLKAPVTFADNFADNTWEDIIKACQSGNVPDTWEVGDQKAMTINGTDYLIDIIGKNHDIYSDGSGTAPLTFQMHDCYGTAYRINGTKKTNSPGWSNCVTRVTDLPAILALMPSEVQAGIKEVNKKTSAGSQSTTINTTADKLFLLSQVEFRGNASVSVTGEGVQYAYYAAGNSAKKNMNGSSSGHWTRSPSTENTTNYCYINTSGGISSKFASSENAISFAFCF